jgi:NTE family protein
MAAVSGPEARQLRVDSEWPPSLRDTERPRVGVVLSGGGLRGAAHIGVLQQLVAHNIPIDVIVGSSAGAIIAAYYAAVGLTFDELVDDARRFRGRHLLAHSLDVRLHRRFLHSALDRMSGVIPWRLDQLDDASFDRLHHGVSAIGIVCHDLKKGRPRYFTTHGHGDVRIGDVVRASASIPFLFPVVKVRCSGESLWLSDGGISDCVPTAFARRAPLSATHLIVSDCRWVKGSMPNALADTVYVRPRLADTGTLWSPSASLVGAVERGAAAMTDEIVARIQQWRIRTRVGM